MNKKIKIVTIGGGSSYTPELIEGFIKRKDKLNIKEIVLVDIDKGKEKLEIVGKLAQRMVRKAGLDWEIKLTLDRKSALKNADFVTTQFRVGLLEARIKDERIPLSHGILGQETNGAGGILKAFRTIPVILDIIEDMKKECPDAWLINFTNPSGMITQAAINHGKWEKTIGLCNVPILHVKAAAKLLDKNEDDLFFKFAGLNHFHWHRVWDKSGKERTEDLIELLYNPDKKIQDKEAPKNISDMPLPYENIKSSKILPCYYHRYYYVGNDMLESVIKDFKNGETRAEKVKETERKLFELYKNEDLSVKPKELEERGGAYYSDAACEIIDAIANDTRQNITVSTVNKKAIDALDYDCVVEITANITSHGAEPFVWGKLPKAETAMLQVMKGMEELAIEAAITGDYNIAMQAFNVNPLIPKGEITKKLLDEMLLAHEEHLPQFKEVIKKLKK